VSALSRHSGAMRKHRTCDVQLHIGESRDSGFASFDAPGMTAVAHSRDIGSRMTLSDPSKSLVGTKTMSAMLLAQQSPQRAARGVYYLLIALGLSLIFSLGGIVNLAHGAFYAIGAYLTLVAVALAGFWRLVRCPRPWRVALLGVVIERTLFRRFYRSDPILSLLMTFGLAMVAEQGLRMIFGAPPLSYSIPPWLPRTGLPRQLHLFVLPRGAARHRRDLHRAAVACCCRKPRSAGWCVPRAEPPTWSARSASRCSLICRPWPRSASVFAGSGRRACWQPIYSIHPRDGPGDHHAGLRGRGDRRARLVLGRGSPRRYWSGLVKGVMVGIGYSAASTAAIYLLMLLVLLFAVRSAACSAERIPAVRCEAPRDSETPAFPLLLAAFGLLLLPAGCCSRSASP